MVSWGWVVIAFCAGIISGMFLAALFDANRME